MSFDGRPDSSCWRVDGGFRCHPGAAHSVGNPVVGCLAPSAARSLSAGPAVCRGHGQAFASRVGIPRGLGRREEIPSGARIGMLTPVAPKTRGLRAVDAELRAFLEDRFGRLERRMDGVEQRLGALEQQTGGVDQRLGGLDQRMDGVDQRLGGLDQQMDGVAQRIGGLERRIDGLEQAMGSLERRIDGLEQAMCGLERRIDGVDQRLGALEPEVASLRSQAGQLGVLLESVEHQVRLVAEGHSVLYGAIDRQYEEVRAELRDVRALLRVWNDLVTRRLGDLEYRIREKVG